MKFGENKTLVKWQITLSFTDVSKSYPSLLTLLTKIKFSQKFSKFTVVLYMGESFQDFEAGFLWKVCLKILD